MIGAWLEGVAAKLSAEPLGTVLNIGSMAGALVENLSRGAARLMVLVEPDPVQFHALQRRHQDNPAVKIVPTAISESTGRANLRRFNLSRATALRRPTGLRNMFPGLLETGQVEVTTQAAETLLQLCELDFSGSHVLILGIAGEEMAMIEMLLARAALQRFEHVVVPLPSLALYEGSADGRAIRERLEAAGFRIESQDLSDPDQPVAYLRLNRDWLALEAERDALAHAKRVADTRIIEIQVSRDEAAKARADAEQQVLTLGQSLTKSTAERDSLDKTLGRTQAERDALAHAKRVADARIIEIQGSRDEAAKARADAEQRLATLGENLARIEGDRQELMDAKSVAEGRVAELLASLEDLEQSRYLVEQELDTLRKTLTRSQKENETLKQAAEEAERNARSEHDLKSRIQILTGSYCHAMRLELHGGASNEGSSRQKTSMALKLLTDLEHLSSGLQYACMPSPRFNLETFKKSSSSTARKATHHVVLDVKSVPRSGLHYMKRQFAKVLQEQFSFCEWYQEPGCCKRMPCVHFSPHEKESEVGSLRMVKSHDFDLLDPIYPVTPGMQRLILTRDPISALTSQWVLGLLSRNKDFLKSNGIQIEKIYFLHEPAVLSLAYQLLEQSKNMPGEEEVATWLKKQEEYLLGFSKKWGAAALMPRTFIVPYEETPLAVQRCLAPILHSLSSEQRDRLDSHIAQWPKNFKPKSDPFQGPTSYLTTVLKRHAAKFQKTAQLICKEDAGGIFRQRGNAEELGS